MNSMKELLAEGAYRCFDKTRTPKHYKKKWKQNKGENSLKISKSSIEAVAFGSDYSLKNSPSLDVSVQMQIRVTWIKTQLAFVILLG